MSSRSPYASALRRSRLVRAEHHPETLADLIALSALNEPTLVLGEGHDGSARPEEPVVLVHTRGLPRQVSVDAESGLAKVSAWSTWSEVDEAAAAHGWTIRHIQDADRRSTVGGTLARASLLPPLWMAQTSVAACVGFEAVTGDGERYRYVDAPRTSSGPDWRALWFGGEGQGGAITSVSLELARAMETTHHHLVARRVSARRLRDALEPFLHVANLVPAPAESWRVQVRGSGHRAALARRHLAALGFAELAPTETVWPERALLIAAPWSLTSQLRALDLPANARWHSWASGPTHVLWVLSGERVTAANLTSVVVQARALRAARLLRFSLRGLLEPRPERTHLPRELCGEART